MVRTFAANAGRWGAVAILSAAWLGIAAGAMGQTWAVEQGAASPGLGAGMTFETSRGPAITTGSLGSIQTTTIPGDAGQGYLMNNGNGTSTLLTPGALPQVVATPR